MTRDRQDEADKDTKPSKWEAAASILVRIIYALGPAVAIWGIIKVSRGNYGLPAAIDPSKLIDQHGPAAIGIPIAAVAALFLISLARALDGPMSFDLFGLRSDGAAATCIVWAILFLVISLSFRALW